MKYAAVTLEELNAQKNNTTAKKLVVGFDGFVDLIVHPVAQRHGRGEDFDRIETIGAFADRIAAAAGKSANIEVFQMMEKLGGNGPIMANALLNAGFETRYIGALGKPDIHPVFKDFAERTAAVSLTRPGVTTAAEFLDGKLMFGNMASLDDVTFEAVLEAMGEDAFLRLAEEADLMAIVNWTMLPQLSSLMNALIEKVYPKLPANPDRHFFFDLADPAKRSAKDLAQAMAIIARFEQFGKVTLGLNYSESQQVAQVLGLASGERNENSLCQTAAAIRDHLKIDCVLVHPTEAAACAIDGETCFTEGPMCDKPLITTGAGDHFNAGFMTGRLLGLSPAACLTMAVSFSGSYVRTGKSPSLDELAAFIAGYVKG